MLLHTDRFPLRVTALVMLLALETFFEELTSVVDTGDAVLVASMEFKKSTAESFSVRFSASNNSEALRASVSSSESMQQILLSSMEQ
jgi:hypothetical protein